MSQNVMFPVNLFYEVYNNHKMGLWEEALTEDYQAHVNGQLIPNRQIGKGFVEAIHTAFPDLKYNLDDTIIKDDKVVTRWTAVGTHTGDFFGMPATNKHISMLGITIFLVRDNKIAELWDVWDQNGLMQQLNS
ncbi:MAG: ester cyclase [Anaerolineaceae bacterium]|nr:ester cyclase [Anaerolineaceae bacterium]